MGREGYLGEFEQMLLLAALRLGDNAYGVAQLRRSKDALLALWDGVEILNAP